MFEVAEKKSSFTSLITFACGSFSTEVFQMMIYKSGCLKILHLSVTKSPLWLSKYIAFWITNFNIFTALLYLKTHIKYPKCALLVSLYSLPIVFNTCRALARLKNSLHLGSSIKISFRSSIWFTVGSLKTPWRLSFLVAVNSPSISIKVAPLSFGRSLRIS